MRVDEVDPPRNEPESCLAGNLGLTISEADLSCRGDYENHSQGNYDYDAHAQVYAGGADPLGSQGFASAVKTSFQLLDAAREANSSRAFLFMGGFFEKSGNRNEVETRIQRI